MAEVSSSVSLGQVAAMIPRPSLTTPSSEATGGNAGTNETAFAQEGHQHPRLTSTTYATLDASGNATVTFSRSFANKPGVNLTETDVTAGTQPLVLRVQSWVQDSGGRYTGCVIRGSRAQMLPTINPLAGTITLISGLLSGVNGLIAQLTGYNVFGGSASGATISVIAVARSDVSSN